MEYGIFTEGTEVLDFNITGEDDNKTAVLNLNQAENNEGVSDPADPQWVDRDRFILSGGHLPETRIHDNAPSSVLPWPFS